MYNQIITLELFRYLEMIEDIKRTFFRLYRFSIHHKPPTTRHSNTRIKKKNEHPEHVNEGKHRRMEEEERVREEKEAFNAIEGIRDEEYTGIHPARKPK